MFEKPIRFYVVGSALSKKRPNDVDIYGVMEDVLFRSVFLDPTCFMAEWRKGRNAKDLHPSMIKWRHENLGATRVLQFLYPELVPIDFKFIPRSLLQEPNLEIDITTQPSTWGINLPGLYCKPIYVQHIPRQHDNHI